MKTEACDRVGWSINGDLLARSHGYSGGTFSTHSFYHADGNGNITALVNSSQAVSAGYRYNPYGAVIGNGNGSPISVRGHPLA